MSPLDLLVVGAFPPEIAPLGSRLGPSLSCNVGTGKGGPLSVAAEAVGIGPVAAAVGMTRALVRRQPRAVIFIGSCGAYDFGEGVSVGELLTMASTRFYDAAPGLGRGVVPPLMPVFAECDQALTRGLQGPGRRCTVATTPSITTDAALGSAIALATGCSVENLEAFGIAHACAAQGIPFGMLLGVTNPVGPSGSRDWQANHQHVAEKVASRVLAWLDDGAEGAPRG